jgi:hypothetical protein
MTVSISQNWIDSHIFVLALYLDIKIFLELIPVLWTASQIRKN